MMNGRPPDIAAGGAYAWQLPNDASGPALARSLLTTTMTELAFPSELVHDGELAVSEIAINAYQHARAATTNGPGAPVELWVWARTKPKPQLIVTVFDSDLTRRPQPSEAGPLDENGKGLRILSAVTVGWGSNPSRSRLNIPTIRGKATWFALPLRQPWPGRDQLIPPAHAAHALLLDLAARGIEGTRRTDDTGISMLELPGANVWCHPKIFSWIDHSGRQACHPFIDLQEATERLIQYLDTASKQLNAP